MSTIPKFTLAEYDRMIRLGIFDPPCERNIELIHGELREMSPPGPPHEVLVDRMVKWSLRNVDDDLVIVRNQNSIGLPQSGSAPQPDVAWVKNKDYWSERPSGEDVFLLIEVADSSLAYDEGEKAALYAEAGIADYWIVNVRDWCVDCYRDPVGESYQSVVRYDMTASVSPLAFPDVSLAVGELFQL